MRGKALVSGPLKINFVGLPNESCMNLKQMKHYRLIILQGEIFMCMTVFSFSFLNFVVVNKLLFYMYQVPFTDLMNITYMTV